MRDLSPIISALESEIREAKRTGFLWLEGVLAGRLLKYARRRDARLSEHLT